MVEKHSNLSCFKLYNQDSEKAGKYYRIFLKASVICKEDNSYTFLYRAFGIYGNIYRF